MTSNTAAAPGRRPAARADDAGAAPGRRFPRALDFWTTWWQKGGHKNLDGARDTLQGSGDPAPRRDTGGDDMAAAHHEVPAHPAASRASTATQPVLVRSYSRSKSRHSSRPASSRASMTEGHGTDPSTTPSTAVDTDAQLPSIDDFKFANLLLTTPSPDVSQAIDAIAEICARSRLSLADEYGAHLPPFSHTLPPMPRTRGQMQSQREVMRLGLGKLERTLTTVPETSSNSECSSPSTSSGRSGSSAYGALTKVLRRSGSGTIRRDGEEEVSRDQGAASQIAMLWQGKGRGTQTVLVTVATPQVSSETATTGSTPTSLPAQTASHAPKRTNQRGQRSSWFSRGPSDVTRSAEVRLRDMLRTTAPG